MAEIIWENNGQGKFDFDYLLKLTNQDFCDAVSDFLDRSRDRNDFVKTIKLDDTSSYVQVFIVVNHGLQVFTYFKLSKNQRGAFINSLDLAWALEVINNG